MMIVLNEFFIDWYWQLKKHNQMDFLDQVKWNDCWILWNWLKCYMSSPSIWEICPHSDAVILISIKQACLL